ncbi:MAG: hypothetical protein HYV24_02465 [Deltaproteobacteria bacterium]|nr:hypothetical protein [Deltaproteobacteria bacterium]
MKKVFLLLGFLFTFKDYSWAETACSNVALEISQEATTERVAFDAKLVLTNNMPDKDLSGLRVDVSIKDKDGNIKNDLFYMKVSSMQNITGVDGTGAVNAGNSAEVHWLIIPSVGAGGDAASGVNYWVGATLTYTIAGKQEIVSVNPDTISVTPMPQLALDYFMPRNVIADNPSTDKVEAAVPFLLGLRVLNDGSGAASKLKIDSAQPNIIDNEQGLLVDFQLMGTSVNDSPVTPSLTVDIGDLGSKEIATASWEMVSTLTGTFTSFDVSFSHSSELGGELTSFIKGEINSHYLVHKVKVNLTGRDAILDFLADTDKDSEHLPDKIFESEIPNGSTNSADSVNAISRATVLNQPARPTQEAPNVSLQLDSNATGWVFAKLDDPSKGMLDLIDVVRGDGVHLDPNNFWIEEGVDNNYQTTYTAWVVDYRADPSVSSDYTLSFSTPSEDLTPPSTSINFDGPVTGANPYYITPSTKIFFTASDNTGGSGVDRILKKLSGQDTDFVSAYPFNIVSPGTYSLGYYSIDTAGNAETAVAATIIVDDSAPVISSFQASPSSFTPHAPEGVIAARDTSFTANVSDTVGSIPVTIEIASSSDFASSSAVRTLTGTADTGNQVSLTWDGKNGGGSLVSTGTYYARITATDGLTDSAVSHTSSAVTTVDVADWLTGTPVDPNLSGNQMYPAASGTNVVWQDNRNGNWDIFTISLSGGQSRALSSDVSDQTNPRIDGNTVVWQDKRNGNWDIYGYDLSLNQELTAVAAAGDQEKPAVSGGWAAWQDNSGGNWDIYAENLSTNETIQVTNHERDQINPVISAGAIFWEDYRNGLGEIYKFDLSSRTESRITVNQSNQTKPTASETKVVWVDQRNSGSGKDLYLYDSSTGETRITYGEWDESGPSLLNNILVYVDNESGTENPDLSFYDLSGGYGGKLMAHSSMQEEPSIATDNILWQDNRDGVYQIYKAAFSVAPAPVTVELKPGINLIAAGDKLATGFAKASDLLSANPDMEKVMSYSTPHAVYFEATRSGGDFDISKGMGLVIYASKAGELQVAESGEAAQYTLLPGENHIGILSVPAGYSAYALINSIGVENIKSIRRFDVDTGLWHTASVRDNSGTKEIVGVNFSISPGDGLIINMVNRVDGWNP